MRQDEVKDEIIRLHDIKGIVKLYGVDEHGNMWTQFEVDAFAEQAPGECAICGAEIDGGWTCLDGGDDVCESHVQYEGEDEGE